jgi:N-formylglutamate amidohydrolase
MKALANISSLNSAYLFQLEKHREFHKLLKMVCQYLLTQRSHALLFDIHSYCYQREEKQTWQEDERPEINIGTGAVNREIFELAIEYKKIFMNE